MFCDAGGDFLKLRRPGLTLGGNPRQQDGYLIGYEVTFFALNSMVPGVVSVVVWPFLIVTMLPPDTSITRKVWPTFTLIGLSVHSP